MGPILLDKNSELFRKKCDKELKTITMILNNIGSGHYLYKLKLKRNIKILKNIT